MTYFTGKSQKAQAWLPTQVAYGMDTSDPDPANWKPFGLAHEQEQAQKAKAAPKTEPKPG